MPIKDTKQHVSLHQQRGRVDKYSVREGEPGLQTGFSDNHHTRKHPCVRDVNAKQQALYTSDYKSMRSGAALATPMKYSNVSAEKHLSKNKTSSKCKEDKTSTKDEHFENSLFNLDRKIRKNEDRKINTVLYENPVFAGGIFNHEGGVLSVAGGAVKLRVTPGAIARSKDPQKIYLYLPHREQLPNIKLGGFPLSPMIHCGQNGMAFEKPVLLSIKSAIDGNVNSFKVLRSDTSPGEKTQWNVIDDGGVHCLWNNGYCTVALTHFTLYTVIGMHNESIVKGVFRVQTYIDDGGGKTPCIRFRVRIFPETQAEMEIVTNREAELGGCSVDPWQRISINQNKGATISLSNFVGCSPMEDIVQDVRAKHIWMIKPSGVVCPFKLKRSIQGGGQARIQVTITVTESENVDNKVQVQVNSVLPVHCDSQFLSTQSDIFTTRRMRCVSNVTSAQLVSTDRAFRHSLPEFRRPYSPVFAMVMPYELYVSLCVQLDIKQCNGRDARYLAENFGIGFETIQYCTQNVSEQQRSLTSALLDFFLERGLQNGFGKEKILTELRDRLLAIDLEQAAALVTKHLQCKLMSDDSGMGDSLGELRPTT